MYSKLQLRGLSTRQLQDLLSNYRDQLSGMSKSYRNRVRNFSTDTQRIKEAITDITAELKLRAVKKNPLKTFAN